MKFQVSAEEETARAVPKKKMSRIQTDYQRFKRGQRLDNGSVRRSGLRESARFEMDVGVTKVITAVSRPPPLSLHGKAESNGTDVKIAPNSSVKSSKGYGKLRKSVQKR